jgi:lipopolysaccharide export system permease protein
MTTLSLLLSKLFIMRFILILFGVTTFVLSLDIVTYADDILAVNNGELSGIWYYALLRAPGIAAQFIMISILIALLLMLTEISRNSELVAIWGAGVSQVRLLAALMPVAIALGLFNFALVDRAVPLAAPTLHSWAIGDYSNKKLSIGNEDPIWMRSGKDIIRAVSTNVSTTKLSQVTVFRRDESGILQEQIMADTAELRGQRWLLTNVTIYSRENLPPTHLKQLIYTGLMRPAATGTRKGDPEEMTVGDLLYFVNNSGFGLRPSHVYSTWVHKRFASLATGILMLFIAIPLAHRYKRGGGLGMLFSAGIGMGFGYFIFDGITLTMGELGILPPWAAGWMPPLIFTGIAGTIAVNYETL